MNWLPGLSGGCSYESPVPMKATSVIMDSPCCREEWSFPKTRRTVFTFKSFKRTERWRRNRVVLSQEISRPGLRTAIVPAWGLTEATFRRFQYDLWPVSFSCVPPRTETTAAMKSVVFLMRTSLWGPTQCRRDPGRFSSFLGRPSETWGVPGPLAGADVRVLPPLKTPPKGGRPKKNLQRV